MKSAQVLVFQGYAIGQHTLYALIVQQDLLKTNTRVRQAVRMVFILNLLIIHVSLVTVLV